MKRIGFFLFLLFVSLGTIAQQERPKIGVVLSGGGAKGIAHIGVLKALEEEGLRPDYISGTSMGSIIGGLYALGYTADQLDTIIRAVNWDLVLSNNIPFEYVAYEEKEYYNRYLFEFPFDKGKLKLPSGMIEGQTLGEVLSRYTWPSKKYSSFDEFPIPFRCIATDVSTGKPIVFKDGSLAKALRSSMAIPTAFTAVDLDSTLVVDGGVVNNFPVEELYNMGADYVIGVAVSEGFKPAHDIENMASILMQVAMIPSSERIIEQKKLCNIYIAPDMQGYSTASFGNYKEILDIGYKTGEEYRPVFRQLADSIGKDQKTIPRVLLNPDSIIIGSIRVQGNNLVTENLILSKLDIDPGQKVSRDDIEDGIQRIYGIMNFKKVDYELKPLTENNGYELLVNARESSPVTLKGAVHYDDIFGIGIIVNTTFRNLIGKSSRTMVIADIAENPKFRANYLKYIGIEQRVAASLTYNFQREQIPYYEEGQVKDLDVTREQNFSLGFMTTQSLKSSQFLGFGYQFLKQKQKFYSNVPEGIKHGLFNFGHAEFMHITNTLNDRNYPISGRELFVNARVYFANDYSLKYQKGVDTVIYSLDVDGTIIPIPLTEKQANDILIKPRTPGTYGTLQFGYKQFVHAGNNFQIIPNVGLGITITTDSMAVFNNFRIGGYQRVRYTDQYFMGLNYLEKDYPNYSVLGLAFQNVLFKKLYLRYGANLLLPYQVVSIKHLDTFDMETLFKENSIIGYGIEAKYKSIAGPISLGIGKNSRDNYFRYYFAIGFSFNYSD